MNNKRWGNPWPDPQHTPWERWSDSEKAAHAMEWSLTIEEAEAIMTAKVEETDEADSGSDGR